VYSEDFKFYNRLVKKVQLFELPYLFKDSSKQYPFINEESSSGFKQKKRSFLLISSNFSNHNPKNADLWQSHLPNAVW
jgi:hypothetical protein